MKLRNSGGVLSGLFCVYGNLYLLPPSWTDDTREAAVPPAESIYVCLNSEAGTMIASQESAWRSVSSSGQRKRKGGGAETQRSDGSEDKIVRTASSGDPQQQASQSKFNISGCYFLPYETYTAFANGVSAQEKEDRYFLWLRCAYRLPEAAIKSSGVYDWLAVDWAIIATITAQNVPEGSEAAVKARNKRLAAVAGAFQTDTEISGNVRGVPFEKKLQKWTDGGDISNVGKDEILYWPGEGSADGKDVGALGPLAFGETTWDQFEENERTFGVKSTYVDGMYSTALNISEIPDEIQRKAEKIAEEMESSQRGRHRGRSHSRDGGMNRWRRMNDRDTHSSYNERDIEEDYLENENDEEARFSAVIGTAHSGKVNSGSLSTNASTKGSGTTHHDLPFRGGKGNIPTATGTPGLPGYDDPASSQRLFAMSGHASAASFRRSANRNKYIQQFGANAANQDGLLKDADGNYLRNNVFDVPDLVPGLGGQKLGEANPQSLLSRPGIYYSNNRQSANPGPIMLLHQQNNASAQHFAYSTGDNAPGLLEPPSEHGIQSRKKLDPQHGDHESATKSVKVGGATIGSFPMRFFRTILMR